MARRAALDLTNCSGIWGCAFRNWGLMRGARKLEAREWDNRWHCYDVLADPHEEHDLGPEGCGDLPAARGARVRGPAQLEADRSVPAELAQRP